MWRRALNRFFGLEESLQIRAARPLVDICVDQAGRKEFYQGACRVPLLCVCVCVACRVPLLCVRCVRCVPCVC